MLVYKDGITRNIAENDLSKWLQLGYVLVEETSKEEPAEETIKPKANKK